MSFDPYPIFDVPRDADSQTLRAAYRRLARENHPDIASDKIAATARMAQINRAWAILGDAPKRAAFDSQWRLQTLETARQNAPQSEEERRETLRREAAQREIARAKAHRAATASQKMKGATNSTKNEVKPRGAMGKPKASTRQRAHDLKARKARHREARVAAGSEIGKRDDSSLSGEKSETSSNHGAPDSPRALRLIGQVALASRLWQRDGNADGAIEICRAVLGADARNVPARELLSEIFASQKRIGVALMMLDQAIQIAPDDRLLRRKRDHLQFSYFGESAPPRPAPPVSWWQRLRDRLLKR